MRNYYIFFSLPLFEKKLFIYAFILNILLPFLIRLFPLKFYYSILILTPKRIISDGSTKSALIAAIRKTINRISKLPLITPTCLIRSTIAKILSANYGINSSIKLYVTKGTSNIHAHAMIDYDSDTNNIQLNNYSFNSYGR